MTLRAHLNLNHKYSLTTMILRSCFTSLFTVTIKSYILCSFVLISCSPVKTNTTTVVPNTIAVWEVESLSPSSPENFDIGELFSSQIIEVIKMKGTHRVVEREQLVLALEELKLGTTSLVDQNSKLKLGQLVGAQLMVFGAYQVISDVMRIDLRLVNVETGKIINAVSKTTQGNDVSIWLEMVRAAASDLL